MKTKFLGVFLMMWAMIGLEAGAQHTANAKKVLLPRPLRRSAGVFAHGILPLQELLPQQHQEQDGGRRSARHGAVGDAQGDRQDLPHRALPPPPLAQGEGAAHGAGAHPRQRGRRKT